MAEIWIVQSGDQVWLFERGVDAERFAGLRRAVGTDVDIWLTTPLDAEEAERLLDEEAESWGH